MGLWTEAAYVGHDVDAHTQRLGMLTPDMDQPAVYREWVEPYLASRAALVFAHGFNIHYQFLKPSAFVDVVLVAPKRPGNLVRRQFEAGRGVPALVAVHQDFSGNALAVALAYAGGLGAFRAGVLQTTFAEETETDLFGEQAVLCGGVTELVTAGFDTLVRAGYQPEVAYFECLHELKLIVDLLHEGGLARMHRFVSTTARFGDLTNGPRVVDAHVRATMQTILDEVRDGTFAARWRAEYESGAKGLEQMARADLDHPIEHVGAKLRERMAWLADADARPTGAGGIS